MFAASHFAQKVGVAFIFDLLNRRIRCVVDVDGLCAVFEFDNDADSKRSGAVCKNQVGIAIAGFGVRMHIIFGDAGTCKQSGQKAMIEVTG